MEDFRGSWKSEKARINFAREAFSEKTSSPELSKAEENSRTF